MRYTAEHVAQFLAGQLGDGMEKRAIVEDGEQMLASPLFSMLVGAYCSNVQSGCSQKIMEDVFERKFEEAYGERMKIHVAREFAIRIGEQVIQRITMERERMAPAVSQPKGKKGGEA